MVHQMLARIFCRQYAPLLVPYAENALDEPQRSRVARHLDACPGCRAEVGMLSDMGALLRSNPPTAAAPAPDLWKRIEAQIMAEQQPVQPVARPVPAPAMVNARSQWRSFGQSFGYSVLPVAAAVAGVVLLVRPFAHKSPAVMDGTKMAAVSSVPRRDVEITFPKAVPSQPRTPAVALKRDVEKSFAERQALKPVVKQRETLRVASADNRPQPSHKIARVATHYARPAIAPSAVLDAAPLMTAAEPSHTPVPPVSGPVGGAVNSVDNDLVRARPAADAALSMSAAKPTADAVAMVSPETSGPAGEKIARRVNLEIERKVVLASEDAILPVREVTAERRVSEVTDEMFRHRNMFSYTR